MNLFSVSVAWMAALACTGAGAQELDMKDETTRINYSVGYQIGGDFKRQGVGLNNDAIVKGIEDALAGTDPQMSSVEMRTTLINLKRKLVSEEREKKQTAAKEKLQAGETFLAENKNKDGVVTLPSGLQYKVLKEGEGRVPGLTDTVTVHYRGTLVNGREFDSSYSRNQPADFQVNGVIGGWTEGLQLMKEGGKYQLFIPYDLAYGRRGALAYETLVFDVELLEVGKDNPTETVQ